MPTGIRNRVKNKDGSISTVLTLSFGTDQGEILIPRVVNNRILSEEDAIKHYERTGESFGAFSTPAEATAYADALHSYHERLLADEAQAPKPLSFRASDILPHLIQRESSGRVGVTGPQTQYGRAQGLTQVLPSTGKALAKKLGVPWRPDLMSGTSEAAANYQRALGQTYLDEALTSTGNVSDALKYYHGGPNRRLWGRKTNAYAADILGRLGV